VQRAGATLGDDQGLQPGESFLRVHWVAVPKEWRARRLNNCRQLPGSFRGQARTNVNSALSELQLLRALPHDLEEVRELMDDDEQRDEQLLDIHVRLVKLEETRARVISCHRARQVGHESYFMIRTADGMGGSVGESQPLIRF
jgi:hypothetical protein